MKYIKSPLNYTGGKYKILKDILPLFPKNIGTFVDLFTGGLNVGINVDAAKIIANDHIVYLIDIYKYLQSKPIEEILNGIEGIIKNYSLSKENLEGYLALRESYNNREYKDPLVLLVLSFFSFNHLIRFNNRHKFNTPFGKNRSSYNERIKSNLILFCEELKRKNIVFESKDFLELDYKNLSKGDFLYADPPYIISNASYNDGKRGFGDWGVEEEKNLLRLLDSLHENNIKFALSNVFVHKGYQNQLLIDWSKKYYTHYIDNDYSNSNYQLKEKNSETVEVLVTNYRN